MAAATALDLSIDVYPRLYINARRNHPLYTSPSRGAAVCLQAAGRRRAVSTFRGRTDRSRGWREGRDLNEYIRRIYFDSRHQICCVAEGA